MKKDDDDIDDTNLDEYEVELTPRSEYMQCAYFAIIAMDGIDTGLMSKEDALNNREIIRKSVKIIDNIIDELYHELFED